MAKALSYDKNPEQFSGGVTDPIRLTFGGSTETITPTTSTTQTKTSLPTLQPKAPATTLPAPLPGTNPVTQPASQPVLLPSVDSAPLPGGTVTLPQTQNPVLLPAPPNMDPAPTGQQPVTLPQPPVPATNALPTVQGSTVAPFGPEADLRYASVLPDPSVDRYQMAQDRFDQFAEATNPAYEATLRAATQRAAANGILGSGMLTNTYGDVATQRAQALDLARRGFLTDALEGTISDARSDRNEVRGERDYQYGVGRQAIEDEIRNLLVGNQLTDSAFDRQLQLASLLGSLGYSGNPDTTLLAGSNQQQQSADQMYQLLAALLAGG